MAKINTKTATMSIKNGTGDKTISRSEIPSSTDAFKKRSITKLALSKAMKTM